MKYLEINRHPARSSQTARRQRGIGWIACRLSTMLDREISPRGSMQNDMFTSVAMLVVANRHIANRKRRTLSEPPRVEASEFRTHERSPVGMIARRVMKAVVILRKATCQPRAGHKWYLPLRAGSGCIELIVGELAPFAVIACCSPLSDLCMQSYAIRPRQSSGPCRRLVGQPLSVTLEPRVRSQCVWSPAFVA